MSDPAKTARAAAHTVGTTSERVVERANQHDGAARSLVHQAPSPDRVLHEGMVHQ